MISYFFKLTSKKLKEPQLREIPIECNSKYIPDEEFITKIQTCLYSLQTKAPMYYRWLTEYELKIRAYSRSGANFDDKAIDIGLETFNSSETWLSSVLIHEAIHFWQYGSGNYDVSKLTEHELEANQHQLRVLQLLEAPSYEIEHMQNLDGKHWDLTGKGSYSEKDYLLRNY